MRNPPNQALRTDHDQLDLRGKTLAQKTVWAGVARFVQTLVQLGTTFVLARMLAPEDFGLVAVLYGLTTFAPMFINMGLGDATVQKRELGQTEISTMFWLNVAAGALISLLLAAASPFIAGLYAQPKLASVATVFGLSFLLNSISVQHLSLLSRRMQFTQFATIELVAAVSGAGVAIGVAALGGSYWALVVRGITAGVVTAVMAWFYSDWRPSRPRLTDEVKKMLWFGAHVSGGAVAVLVSNGLDRIFLGLLYVPRVVGFYQNALIMYEQAYYGIFWPLHRVGISALSKFQSDPIRFREKYCAALGTVSFFTMGGFACVAVTAEDLLPLLLGEKWAAAGALLAIFSIRGMFHVIESSQNWLHLPLGRPDRGMRWAIFTALVQAAAVLAGLRFGPTGVALAIVISRGLLAFPSVIYAGRPLHLRFSTIIHAVGRQLCSALVALLAGKAALNYLPETFSRIPRIAIGGGTCLLAYLVLAVGILRVYAPLHLVSSMIAGFVPAKYRSWLPFLLPVSTDPVPPP